MSDVQIFRVDLPPNNSFQCRYAVFARQTSVLTIPVGVLTVTEMVVPGSSKKHVRRYAVVEVPGTDDGRVFRLSKPEDQRLKPGQDRTYHVCVRRGGGRSECECHGYGRDSVCVHVLAMEDLFKQGALKKGGES